MVKNQSLELQKTDLKLPVVSEETELGIALQETKICQLKDLEPLKEVLRLVMVLVGLRAQNFPQDQEKAVLLKFIVDHYGGHTPSEIKLAFTMAINGRLGLETKEVVCYENFSVLYFSSIMNAYRSWAKEAVFHIPKIPLPELPAPTSNVSNEEFIESVRSVYNTTKKWKAIPVLAYDVLFSEGKINLTKEQKFKIKSIVDEAWPDLPDESKPEYYKSYAVMLHFENMSL